MAKQDQIPSYPCMAPPPNSRLVHHPHDEPMVVPRGRVRKLVSTLLAQLHRTDARSASQ